MRKIIALLLISFSLLTACDKSENEKDNTEYYVEYQARYTVSGGNWQTITTSITYATPEGSATTTLTRDQSFSVTVGPFKKGDNAYISGKAPTSGYSHTANAAILVKKGDAPFVRKAESTTSLSCNYTIDF